MAAKKTTARKTPAKPKPEAVETAPEAAVTPPIPPPAHPGPNTRFEQGICIQCGRVNDHTHAGV